MNLKNMLRSSYVESGLEESLDVLSELRDILRSLRECGHDDSKAVAAMTKEHEEKLAWQKGFVLGQLKALADTLPQREAACISMDDLPLDLGIKLQVDHLIREARERLGAAEFTQATGHAKYRRLSEVVCGYGYSMRFSEERFAKFYPGETRWLVAGFAEGYSTAFHSIATEAGLYTDQTLPVGQDIWKNWAYFLEPDCREYRLDGKYLFMYHGGINCSDTAAPYGDNQKNVNAGVYKALQARDLAGAGDRFGEIVFNF